MNFSSNPSPNFPSSQTRNLTGDLSCPITTQVLDLNTGTPVPSIPVTLEFEPSDSKWVKLGHARTNAEGKVNNFLPDGASLQPGNYRLRFETAKYFESKDQESFYPRVEICFKISSEEANYHVPLLLSPFGYSTFRGHES